MASEVRQNMIEAAMYLIASKGVQATSFADVLKASGAPRGSVYHHFPGGKDELVLAAMDNAMDMARAFVEPARGKPADKVAEAFIGFWRDVLTDSRLGCGCTLLAVTLAPDTPAQRTRAGEMFKSWRELLSSMLIEGGVHRERAPGLAAGLLAACEGAVALARAEKSVKPFNLVAAEQVRSVRDAMR